MMYEIVELAENVYHIHDSLGVYCTLITGTHSALLVDTGYGFNDLVSCIRSITDLPIMVINTHGHVDHIQGNRHFKEVMIHPGDRTMSHFHSTFLVKTHVHHKKEYMLTAPESRHVKDYYRLNKYRTRAVKDGQVIDLGNTKIEIIHTPGHTKGSICLLDHGHRLLLTGDTVSSLVWLFLPDSCSLPTYRASLAKLWSRRSEYDRLVCSHCSARFHTTLLAKMRACADHVSIEKSTSYDSRMLGKALLYAEGMDRVYEDFGFACFEDLVDNIARVDQGKLERYEYVSLAYTKHKLNSHHNFDKYASRH